LGNAEATGETGGDAGKENNSPNEEEERERGKGTKLGPRGEGKKTSRENRKKLFF